MTDRRDRLSAKQPPSTSRRGESGDRRSRKSPQPAASSAVPQSLRGGRIRCAVYTRKSSEEGLEQQFNSLDAQREACEAYVRSQKHEGWKVLPQLYDDPGFRGEPNEGRRWLGSVPQMCPADWCLQRRNS